MVLERLEILNIRQWPDLGIWIAEEIETMSTKRVVPRNWVAPLQFETSPTYILRENKILYRRVELYQR